MTQSCIPNLAQLIEANRAAYEAKLKIKKTKKKEVRDKKRDRFEFVDFLTLIHKDLAEGVRIRVQSTVHVCESRLTRHHSGIPRLGRPKR